MKITGYTRLSDTMLKRKIVKYIRYKGEPESIFKFGNPLCAVDSRRCQDKGKIESGVCKDPYSCLVKFGKCRKVEVEYKEIILVKEV